MGLDLGFYTGDGTGVLEFRGHDGLLDRILAVTHDRIAPFSDFHVTRPMVTSLLAGIEADLRALGAPVAPRTDPDELSRENLCRGVPEGFCDEPPETWRQALPHYRLLLTRLLDLVDAEGHVICSWSV